MATDKKNAPNIDLSDIINYPHGRIKDNTGAGDGTPVNRLIYSDMHEFFAKLMRLANIQYNGLPDNESNKHQLVAAAIALAGKNDFYYSLSNLNGVIIINTDLSIINIGEMLIASCGFDLSSETSLKGSAAALYSLTIPSKFKSNDYVRLIKTGPSTFLIQRLADGSNIDALVAEFNFLKGATELEEFAGASLTKATTPYTNQISFSRRVNGIDSHVFLVSSSRNGLMSKEDKQFLDSLEDPVKNRGWFSGLDPGSSSQIGASLPRSGDITSAVVSSVGGSDSTVITVTFQNPIAGANYYVRMSIESEGDFHKDNGVGSPVFKKINSTQFYLSIQEIEKGTQSLKIHLEVVAL